jgi:4'-phosphopantetheinyl transferase
MLNRKLVRDHTIHLAVVRPAALSAASVGRWVTHEDRVYAEDRARPDPSLWALTALRALLFAVTGRTDWHVGRAAGGKPSVMTSAGECGPAVSLSHTTGLIGVAVAQGNAVGIDVERHRCRTARNLAALADQAFGVTEQAEVAAEGLGAFYRIWTLREAMGKATGEGLALALNRCDLAHGVVANRVQHRAMSGRAWQLFHLLPDPTCSLGLAWYGDEAVAAPRWVELASLLDTPPVTAKPQL